MADDRALRDARDRHDALVSELADLPAAISAAQSEVRVEDWMRLQNRAAVLPDEIHRARLEVLPLELAAAWTAAEAAHSEETRLGKVNAAARRTLDDFYRDTPHRGVDTPHRDRTAVELAERNLAFTRATEAQDTADQAYREARDATCLALLRVDAIEAEIVEVTGEPLQYGDGLRAAPRPLTASLVTSRRDLGVLAEHLDDVVPGPDDRSSRSLPTGLTPPRWLTHRLGLDERFFAAATAAPVALSSRIGRRPGS